MRAILPDMRWEAQIGLLALAIVLAGGSGQSGGSASAAGPLRAELDSTLNQPALRVVNRTDHPIRVRLHGPLRREVVVPPREVTRTLVAAGDYRYEVWRGEHLARRGQLRLAPGHRYHLVEGP